jgi:hypothetical protein
MNFTNRFAAIWHGNKYGSYRQIDQIIYHNFDADIWRGCVYVRIDIYSIIERSIMHVENVKRPACTRVFR